MKRKPDVTRTRLYLEAMEKIFAQACSSILSTSDKGTRAPASKGDRPIITA